MYIYIYTYVYVSICYLQYNQHVFGSRLLRKLSSAAQRKPVKNLAKTCVTESRFGSPHSQQGALRHLAGSDPTSPSQPTLDFSGRWHASHALAPAGNEMAYRKRGNDPSQSKTESFGASRADCGAKSQAHGPHPGPVLQVHFGRYPLPGSFE